ncbi:recombination and DNA strand exchange inhibitor protein [compost metagenome]
MVDLHIEKLVSNHKSLSSDAILKKQLDIFESNLESAIANGMDEITFIHGAGSGALKNELHRRLGKNQHVQFFKDALKEKFGYGATLVKIK